jgi:hypothetical protein
MVKMVDLKDWVVDSKDWVMTTDVLAAEFVFLRVSCKWHKVFWLLASSIF